MNELGPMTLEELLQAVKKEHTDCIEIVGGRSGGALTSTMQQRIVDTETCCTLRRVLERIHDARKPKPIFDFVYEDALNGAIYRVRTNTQDRHYLNVMSGVVPNRSWVCVRELSDEQAWKLKGHEMDPVEAKQWLEVLVFR